MAVDQLPGQVREFANYLNGLLARLDGHDGWCAVFWQRDPDGMRACLDGREIPPWDVVEALLQDLAAGHGPGVAAAQRDHARPLHSAALTAYDTRPGARDELTDRLDAMFQERRHAAERHREPERLLASATTSEAARALRHDLAWARDDHRRATARCEELRTRLAESDRREAAGRARDARPIRRGADGNAVPGGYDLPAGPRDGAAPGAAGSSPRLPAGVPAPRDRPGARPGAPSADGRLPAAEGFGEGIGHGAAAGGDARGDGRYPGAPDAVRDGGPAVGAHPVDRATESPHGDPLRPAGPRAREHGHDVPADGHRAAPATSPGAAGARTGPGDVRATAATAGTAATPPGAAEAAPPVERPSRRRRGSARFAGAGEDDGGPVPVPPVSGPVPPVAAVAAGRRAPLGARFAGAVAAAEPSQPRAEPPDTAAALAVADAVRALARLRGAGRTGEAHALLVEAAQWPPARLPLLAAELHRAGLGADWATLLWEAASLPAGRLVAAADALVAAGRAADGERILRQGVARPAGEIGAAVLGLAHEGRAREVRALLDAYVRVRTPQEAARSAAADPQRLVPLLLEAARNVSDERHWDLVHALRVAGFAA
ncbi:hypothetical protein ACFC09_27410 [Streptomyces sp. NPDC056161]|uniref:hypothetical protein n=1 Tax=Streptomyces sp. NPDC056161 TaxID=3345732 RepID=UPI0035DC4541